MHVLGISTQCKQAVIMSRDSSRQVGHMWAALREKVPNVLSRCHNKRRAGTAPDFSK